MRFDFTVKVGEKKYGCHRMVSGATVFRQTVYVDGFGSKPDGASYGPGERPVDTMELNAKLIAAELIKRTSGQTRGSRIKGWPESSDFHRCQRAICLPCRRDRDVLYFQAVGLSMRQVPRVLANSLAVLSPFPPGGLHFGHFRLARKVLNGPVYRLLGVER